MNSIAERALAQARKRGNAASALRPQAPKITQPAPAPMPTIAQQQPAQLNSCHISRVLYLEGRRHALDLVRDLRGLLELPDGARLLAGRLGECMQAKPHSFALGVAFVIKLLEEGING